MEKGLSFNNYWTNIDKNPLQSSTSTNNNPLRFRNSDNSTSKSNCNIAPCKKAPFIDPFIDGESKNTKEYPYFCLPPPYSAIHWQLTDNCPNFTDAQKRVLLLLMKGYDYSEIAGYLEISYETVKNIINDRRFGDYDYLQQPPYAQGLYGVVRDYYGNQIDTSRSLMVTLAKEGAIIIVDQKGRNITDIKC